MPGPRGRAPTSRARFTPSKIFSASAPISTPARLRERAVVELHDDALERLERGLDLEQPQLDRAVAGQRAAREAEQQAVADLAGSTGDGDLEGGRAHETTPEWDGLARMDASSGRVRDDGRVARRPGWYVALALAVVARRRRVRRRVAGQPALGHRRAGDPDPVAGPAPTSCAASTTRGWRSDPAATWTLRRSPAPRRGDAGRSPSRTSRSTVAGVATTPVVARTEPGPATAGRRLLRPGPARQRLVVRPRGRVAGRRGRRRGRAGDARARRGWATAGARRTTRAWSTCGSTVDTTDQAVDHAGREVHRRWSGSTSASPLAPGRGDAGLLRPRGRAGRGGLDLRAGLPRRAGQRARLRPTPAGGSAVVPVPGSGCSTGGDRRVGRRGLGGWAGGAAAATARAASTPARRGPTASRPG